MLPENIVWIGVLINLIGVFVYVRSILLERTKPNLVSWTIWMLAPFIGVFLQLEAGAGLSVLPVFMAGFGPLVVIIVSILKKNAYWKITPFDIVCGIFSVAALLLYVVTHQLAVSILFAIVSDGLAAIPTIIKSWKFPESESASAYLGGIASNVLGLLTIKQWTFSIYSFGAYIIILNVCIVAIIYRKSISIFSRKK